MRAFLTMFLICCIVVGSFAQITITAGDVSAQLSVGNRLINRLDTLTVQAYIGVPGTTANVWNFGGLATHLLDTLTSVLPSGSPYISWFPGATHTLQQRQTLMGITGTVWLYLELGANLRTRGAGGDGPTPLGTAVLRVTNTPPEVLYQLPMTLGTSWTTTYRESLIVTIGGFPLLQQVTDHTIINTVDAHGTLTLPGTFGSHQALRIRSDDRYSGASSGRSISYQFIARNGASVQVAAVDTTQPNSGTILINPFSTSWSGPIMTDVAATTERPTVFALHQNYPNPFNPMTRIEFGIQEAGFTTLRVYDVLGREVATLVDQQKKPGIYTVQWDATGVASGVYFYRLESGRFVETRRMILMR